MDSAAVKKAIVALVTERQGEIAAIVEELYRFPETGLQEAKSAALLAGTLERIYFREPPYDTDGLSVPADVLDVGTGSGVLAIAAVKMGARRVLGIDIDPAAVEVARQNLAQNLVDLSARVTSEPLANITGTFDVVLANILAEDLVRLGPELVGKLREGGVLILSGILSEKEELVTSGFSPFPLTLVEVTRSAEWSCIAYRREG